MSPFTQRGAAALAVLALAAFPAACGGGDSEPAPEPGGGAEVSPAPNAGGEDAGAGTGGADGRGLFASSCASCHTLSAADATGTIGPNLDELKPDREEVLRAIAEGPDTMPENLYEGAEAEAVADFVSENAGK